MQLPNTSYIYIQVLLIIKTCSQVTVCFYSSVTPSTTLLLIVNIGASQIFIRSHCVPIQALFAYYNTTPHRSCCNHTFQNAYWDSRSTFPMKIRDMEDK